MTRERKILNFNGALGSLLRWGLVSIFAICSPIVIANDALALVERSENGDESTSCSKCVRLKVVVSKFIPVATTDDFVEGYGVVYSHTILSVIEPVDLSGRKLTIEHTSMPEEGSLWRSVGEEAVIALRPFALESLTVIIPVREVRIQDQEHLDSAF